PRNIAGLITTGKQFFRKHTPNQTAVIKGDYHRYSKQLHIPAEHAAKEQEKGQYVHHAAGANGAGVHIFTSENIDGWQQPYQQACEKPTTQQDLPANGGIKMKQKP